MANLDTIINNSNDFLTGVNTGLSTPLNDIHNILDEIMTISWTASAIPSLSDITAITGDNFKTLKATPDIGSIDAGIVSSLATMKGVLDLAIFDKAGFPDPPPLDTFTAPVWQEDYWTGFKTLLTNFTSNITNGDDVDTVVTKLTSETGKLQVALYAADRERKQQTLRDAYSAANASTGSRGFSYPNSMTMALKLAAQQQYQFEMSQTARDLIKLIFEWAKSNYQFSIDKQISAHNADTEFNSRYADTLIRVYDTEARVLLERYKTEVSVQIEKLDRQMKEYIERAQILKINADIASEPYRLALQKYSAAAQENVAMTQNALTQTMERYRARLAGSLKVVETVAAMASSAGQIAVGLAQG